MLCASPTTVTGPVFRALVADLPVGDPGALSSAHASVWRAIDQLRALGDPGDQIGILEEVARELHGMRWPAGRSEPGASAARLAGLTRAWLERAPILC